MLANYFLFLFILFIYFFFFLFYLIVLIYFNNILTHTQSQVPKIEKQDKNSKRIKGKTHILNKRNAFINTYFIICSIYNATFNENIKMKEHYQKKDFIDHVNYKLSKLSTRFCFCNKDYVSKLKGYQC